MVRYKDYTNAVQIGYWNGKLKYCRDITSIWLGVKSEKNKVIIPKVGEEIKYKGKKYKIENKHIKLEFKNGEKEFADIISKLTNKKIELFPRFDYFKSVDAKIGKDYVDFKITTSGTDKFIFKNINDAKEQSKNFLFWIKNKKVTEDIIKYQIDNVFRRVKSIKIIGYYIGEKIYIYQRK